MKASPGTVCVAAILAVLFAPAAQAQPTPAYQLLRAQAARQAKATTKAEEPAEQGKAPESEAALIPTSLDRPIDRATYRLGPGDQLLLNLWGTTNQSFPLTVTPEGDLLIPSLGPVLVARLTLADAERRVVAEAAGVYQNARLTLSLVALRTFGVHVAGRVGKPGTYAVTAADRVNGVIEVAGGLANNASLRRIRLDRRDAAPFSVDLQMFFATGDASLNPTLEMGDVIVVPARADSVSIWGAVMIEGSYEYRPGDTVSELLRLAGGLTEDAQLAQVEWSTFPVDSGVAVLRTVDLSKVLGSPLDSTIRPGDRILIHSWPDWRRRQSVRVQGEVHLPGVYSIVEGQVRLSDVLRRAGGVTEDASPEDSRIIRGQIYETPDPEYERLLKMLASEMRTEEYAYFKARSRQVRGQVAISFAEAIRNPGGVNDPPLIDRDVVIVARRRETIEVAGQVARPGLVAHQEGKPVAFYIEQAGGVSWNANERGIRVIKATTGVWVKPREEIVLEPGDTIFVPEKPPKDWWELFKDGLLVTSQIATTIFIIQSIAR